MFTLILLVIALVLFVLAAFFTPARVSLVALGLAALTGAFIAGHFAI